MSTQGPTDTRTSTPAPWFSQFAQNALNAGGQLAQQPYQPYNYQRVADLSGLQNQALGNMGALPGAAMPMLGAASDNITRTLSGGFDDPFQQQVIDRMTRGVTDQYNNAVGQTSGRFNTAGNWGSARQGLADEMNQRALATGLGDATGSVLSGNFQNERNRQMQVAGMAPQMLSSAVGSLSQMLAAGDVPRLQQQRLLDSRYQDFTDQRDYGWTQLQRLAGLSGLGGAGAGTTSTSRQGYDPVSQGIGLATLGSNKGGSGSSLASAFGNKGGSGYGYYGADGAGAVAP